MRMLFRIKQEKPIRNNHNKVEMMSNGMGIVNKTHLCIVIRWKSEENIRKLKMRMLFQSQ